MNTEEFRKNGRKTIDYICDYMDTMRSRPVQTLVPVGYLRKLVADEAPIDGEEFDDIMKDVEEKIVPGLVQWNHPDFFAYFPSGNSYPSILGDLLSSAFGVIAFSWASSPSATELETIVLDMYAKALGLPEHFLSTYQGEIKGGGALQGSASDSVLVSLITARARAISSLKKERADDVHDSVFLPQLIAYTSKNAHSCVEKAAKMAIVKLRILETDYDGRLTGDVLRKAIETDVADGLTPFFVVATLGTTGECAFDHLHDIGKVCKEFPSIWLHVDGAYAGSSFILPEMRPFMRGIEYADSFCTNPNKLMLTNFDASALWVRNAQQLQEALVINPLYLEHQSRDAIDYRNFSVPLSRRFRALKLWFVFRTYGISGIQKYIRNHMKLAKHFEQLVRKDPRFEVSNNVHLGLVCFRLIQTNGKDKNATNTSLLNNLNLSQTMHLIPSKIRGNYILRFCVTYEHANVEDMERAWRNIQTIAEQTLNEPRNPEETKNPCKAPSPKKNRLSTRFSFTRSVSRDVYERQASNPNLTDGCTPIIVLDTNPILDSLQRESKRNQMLQRHEEVDLSDEASN